MRRTNCRSVRREIETAASSDLLSSLADAHLKNCIECETFRAERLKLREIISGLGVVEAPGDFDFRLRARLAREKQRAQARTRDLSFGLRSAAFATMLLLIGSALVYVSLRSPADNSLSSQSQPEPSKTEVMAARQLKDKQAESTDEVAAGLQTSQRIAKEKLSVSGVSIAKSRGRSGRGEVALVRNKGRLRTRDLGTTPARVVSPANLTTGSTASSVFPIDASYQSLKVSLDDGRGSSRTISLPSVSFGSQRVLAQSTSPLLASARDTW